jgi:hypothetical protein
LGACRLKSPCGLRLWDQFLQLLRHASSLLCEVFHMTLRKSGCTFTVAYMIDESLGFGCEGYRRNEI